ncbi:hypothetical protein DICPUDRAFT_98485 [Dictyostelium purpureum]|uniref:PA14 domain-containing protein n=1 Tax=Dictyostelium purpureum TaxID=5786 RepID=F0ZQR8_DICPU|nr:uncharacterized protein DICPUDRAFT_98485 [Dictyostelium purpureum]EGC33725.1 hypothetical protein DICPUDRAFT_98485 [Dictyostelium purpureum]|eukprot:XP_003289764.1 hypothetical protein DICPUDRAFT_98485 [Dictyostelium purpureum]
MDILKKTLLIFSIFLLYGNLISSQDTIDLTGVIFDQSPARNPDFEINPYSGGVTPGIVLNTLGANGTPQYCCGNNPVMKAGTFVVHNQTTFSSWFNPASGINIAIPITLTLTRNANGVYTHQSQSFFPIDGQGFDNRTNYPNEVHYFGHNYHFCMRIHYSFVYRGGEYFKFTGDDDVWVYFNNKLSIDIGGIHQGASRTVMLDQLGLTRGQTYPWDFFYCERHTTASTLNIETNLIFQCAYYDRCNVCQGKNDTCCFENKCFNPADPCLLYDCNAGTNFNCKRRLGECNNGDLCSNSICIRGIGCQYSSKCDDLDPCTLDNCASATGACTHTPVSCDDGNRCTNDLCDSRGGKCVNVPVSCDDGDECTNDHCSPVLGCLHTTKNCIDNLGCTVDTCDSATGCVNTLVANCTECHESDIAQCITTDLCFPKVCDPLNNNECITHALNCSIFETECIDVKCVNGECRFRYTCETPQPSESPTASLNVTVTPVHPHTLRPTVTITQPPTPTPTGTPLPPNKYHDDVPPEDLLSSCLVCEDLNCKSHVSDNGQPGSCTYVKNDLYDEDNCEDCCLWIPTCYYDSALPDNAFALADDSAV